MCFVDLRAVVLLQAFETSLCRRGEAKISFDPIFFIFSGVELPASSTRQCTTIETPITADVEIIVSQVAVMRELAEMFLWNRR
jgi:hypothetical protein